MKKKLLFAVLICVVACSLLLTACNSSKSTLSACWTAKETITYEVTKANGDKVGTLVTTLERDPADKTLDGETYDNATTRFTATYTHDGQTMNSTSLLNGFAPIASSKVVATADSRYTISAKYSGKYYTYTLDDNGAVSNGKIKVKGAYMDNELLYTYLRCDDVSAINTTIKIPNPLTNTAEALTVSSVGTENLAVRFGEGNEKVIATNKVQISKTESPIGSGITVFFASDNAENELAPQHGGSTKTGKKYPVKIIENDMTYTMVSIIV